MPHSGFLLSDATLEDIQQALEKGTLTSERLVCLYLDRIEAYDKQGPRINAVITLNRECLEMARDSDRERRENGPRSLLHGIPVVLKDTIDAVGMPTTGGFTGLANSYPARDSAVARRLKEAGALILAKVNANDWFGKAPMSASTLGGQTRNPYNLDYTTGGSSCGSAAALAANFSPLGLGTDTSGSVLMPSADCGLFGMIPSKGYISRAGIMPIAPTMARVGVMARSTFGLAALLPCLMGWDPEDLTTNEALGQFPRQGYSNQLSERALGSFRIGVLREMWRNEPRHEEGVQIMDTVLELLHRNGAILVDPVLTGINLRDIARLGSNNSAATSYELLPSLDAYFARLGPNAPYKTIREMIDALGIDNLKGRFAEALSLPPPETSDYYLARRRSQIMLKDAIKSVMLRHGLDAVVLPYCLSGPKRIDGKYDDETRSLASHAGLPSIVVPAGFTKENIPLAIQFITEPYNDLKLLQLASLLENIHSVRKLPETVPALPNAIFPLPGGTASRINHGRTRPHP